jgi:uncharacterized membrane protein
MTTDHFTEQLPQEISAWRQDNLISVTQARAIMARYGLTWAESEESRRRGRLSNVVMTLGALLTGVGVIVFVASNWDQLNRVARMVLLVMALGLAYGSALWANRCQHTLLGAALVFLGSLVFGANIFIVAQTYHLNSGGPLLMVFWAAGALATAYTASSRPSMYLGVLGMLLWYVFQIVDWDMFSHGQEAAALSAAAYLPLGLVSFNLGAIHRSYPDLRRFAGAMVNFGIITVFVALLVFSFAEVWRSLASESSRSDTGSFQRIVILYSAFSIAALLSSGFAIVRLGINRQGLVHALGVLVIGLSSLMVVFHPFDSPGAYALAFNVILLAAVLWGVGLGIWTRQEPLINLALIFFALQVMARYFDFFFSLFDRSLVFIGAGTLLLIGGWLVERSRRVLIARMLTETGAGDV